MTPHGHGQFSGLFITAPATWEIICLSLCLNSKFLETLAHLVSNHESIDSCEVGWNCNKWLLEVQSRKTQFWGMGEEQLWPEWTHKKIFTTVYFSFSSLFLAIQHGLWDLSFLTHTFGSGGKAQRPNHWTTREFPIFLFISGFITLWTENALYLIFCL